MENIKEILEKYIIDSADIICQNYELDKEEIINLLKTHLSISTKIKPESKAHPEDKKESEEFTPAVLFNCSKKELEAICKSKKLKVSGKKEELVARILGVNSVAPPENTKKKSPKTKKSPQTKKSNVVEKLEKNKSNYLVSRNKWGNYEHQPTHLVFNQQTEEVYGRQEDDGSVVELTDEDIQNCLCHKFKYVLPDNLNKNKKPLDDVKIEEIDEEKENNEGEEAEEVEQIEEVEEIDDVDDIEYEQDYDTEI
jgi:hypothetical protein